MVVLAAGVDGRFDFSVAALRGKTGTFLREGGGGLFLPAADHFFLANGQT